MSCSWFRASLASVPGYVKDTDFSFGQSDLLFIFPKTNYLLLFLLICFLEATNILIVPQPYHESSNGDRKNLYVQLTRLRRFVRSDVVLRSSINIFNILSIYFYYIFTSFYYYLIFFTFLELYVFFLPFRALLLILCSFIAKCKCLMGTCLHCHRNSLAPCDPGVCHFIDSLLTTASKGLNCRDWNNLRSWPLSPDYSHR